MICYINLCRIESYTTILDQLGWSPDSVLRDVREAVGQALPDASVVYLHDADRSCPALPGEQTLPVAVERPLTKMRWQGVVPEVADHAAKHQGADAPVVIVNPAEGYVDAELIRHVAEAGGETPDMVAVAADRLHPNFHPKCAMIAEGVNDEAERIISQPASFRSAFHVIDRDAVFKERSGVFPAKDDCGSQYLPDVQYATGSVVAASSCAVLSAHVLSQDKWRYVALKGEGGGSLRHAHWCMLSFAADWIQSVPSSR